MDGIDYIRSSQVRLHVCVGDMLTGNVDRLLAVLTDALGSKCTWPEYAIYGDRIYARGDNAALDSSMGEFHSIFGAREYTALAEPQQTTMRNDTQSARVLAKALIFIP